MMLAVYTRGMSTVKHSCEGVQGMTELSRHLSIGSSSGLFSGLAGQLPLSLLELMLQGSQLSLLLCQLLTTCLHSSVCLKATLTCILCGLELRISPELHF